MHIEAGDRLLVSERFRNGRYVCRVVSAPGPDGAAPCVVLRYDTGHVEVLEPDADLIVGVLAHASV